MTQEAIQTWLTEQLDLAQAAGRSDDAARFAQVKLLLKRQEVELAAVDHALAWYPEEGQARVDCIEKLVDAIEGEWGPFDAADEWREKHGEKSRVWSDS